MCPPVGCNRYRHREKLFSRGGERSMAGVARPESVQSWQEGDREQAKREGREIQIWKEHVPMESMSTYMAGAVLPSHHATAPHTDP